MYPPRYLCEPRKRSAYIKCFDMIDREGYPLEAFPIDKYNVTIDELKEIWAKALKDVSGHSVYCGSADYCPAN